MTDRELLEAAARAAGMDVIYMALSGFNIVSGPRVGPWNPMDDDGDALRLAVTMRFFVISEPDCIEVGDFEGVTLSKEYVKSDRFWSTRRAIVRAAAEVSCA